METSLNLVSIICIGLLIGTEFAVSAFIHPVLAQVGGNAEAHATSLLARKLGTFMPFWYGLCFLLLIGEAVVERHVPGLAWIVAAAAVWAAVMVLTVIFLVPINNRIAAMGPETFDSSLRAQHARWDALHRGRVVVLLGAMICLLIGIRL